LRQVLVRIPIPFLDTELPIFGYGLMLFLGFVCCGWWAMRRARREGIDPDNIVDMAMWVFFGGLIGARLFFVVQKGLIEQTGQVTSFWDVFTIWKGGLVYYGGLIGGLAGFLIVVRRRRWNLLHYLDLVIPPAALGLAFGRAGCFLNGCCFGDVCRLPWAIRFPGHFPTGSIPYVNQVWSGWITPGSHMLAVHPTQLYSLANAVLMALLAAAYYRIRRRDGETIGLLMLAYPITRFLLERVRNDEGAIWITGLTISQNVSVAMLALGIWFAWHIRRRPAQHPPGGPDLTTPAPAPVPTRSKRSKRR